MPASARPLALLAALALGLAACLPLGQGGSPAPTAAPAATIPPATAAPSAQPAATQAPASTPAASANQIRLILAGDGNEARFRVKEQLAGLDLPSDAVGATQAISGQLVLTTDGAVVPAESKFTVELSTLRTDSGMRDGFIQRNTLETQRYPTAEFVPNEAQGLPSPLPTSGAVNFQLLGDLTIHGVTRPTTWAVTAQVTDGQSLTGTATTAFTFADFGLTQPRVGRVLSIEDNIRLEYDFHLVRDNAGSP